MPFTQSPAGLHMHFKQSGFIICCRERTHAQGTTGYFSKRVLEWIYYRIWTLFGWLGGAIKIWCCQKVGTVLFCGCHSDFCLCLAKLHHVALFVHVSCSQYCCLRLIFCKFISNRKQNDLVMSVRAACNYIDVKSVTDIRGCFHSFSMMSKNGII